MKEDKLQEEVMKILDEAANSRKLLGENYDNFMNVADYCCKNYIESGADASRALEETKTLTAQSLASIAYQISTLAASVLGLLDMQTLQLGRMESSVNLIGQTVEMHREKVSRREIGTFTAVRRVPRGPKISMPPAGSHPRPSYDRHPISYQQLDDLGHGVKLSGKEREGTFRKATSSIRCSKPKAKEGLKSALAPSVGSSTFGKPVAPPTIPQVPLDNHVLAPPLEEIPPPPPDSSLIDEEITLAPPLSPPETPPIDLFLPLTPPPCLETVLEESSLPPPSPPLPDHAFCLPSNEEPELPAPPPMTQEVDDLELPSLPPPPPPPPPLDDQAASDVLAAEELRGAPPNYLEKVVALYDYEAAKPDDLSLMAGDVIYVIHRHDNGCQQECCFHLEDSRRFEGDRRSRGTRLPEYTPWIDAMEVIVIG
ncbi:ABI family, member 3a isoform X2 [Corythoichthys intestinalis]|uniref:ABI family, member 3a isoform X2 n=1 Tax=Corythoichthys intestinalis TaxID=161448 RepID=UPI0025A62C99|nr:ABI family, member 3a isoform X2 [Corythoichthys intestinalis]